MQMYVPSSHSTTSSDPQQGHCPVSCCSIFFSPLFLWDKGNEFYRESSLSGLFLLSLFWSWIMVSCADVHFLFGQLCLGLSAISCIHNILRRKGKANRECAKYRHPFCKSIPWHSDRQPSSVFHLKNWVFLTECPAIPCLHSLSCTPSSWRCKKLIPDGIQPIKKNCPWGASKK